jgi:hypothetical protein
MSIEQRFGNLLEKGDPEELYDLVDLLATGSYGKVYTVIVFVCQRLLFCSHHRLQIRFVPKIVMPTVCRLNTSKVKTFMQ